LTGKRSRTKGHNFEREMAKHFQSLGFTKARRGIQYRDGAECPDVMGVGDIWVECKIGARPNIKAAMEQASEACGRMRPIAITKWNRGETYVTMRMDLFDDLMKMYYEVNCS
jgi:Holliday junction resolvase